jgi:hypothetical protein
MADKGKKEAQIREFFREIRVMWYEMANTTTCIDVVSIALSRARSLSLSMCLSVTACARVANCRIPISFYSLESLSTPRAICTLSPSIWHAEVFSMYCIRHRASKVIRFGVASHWFRPYPQQPHQYRHSHLEVVQVLHRLTESLRHHRYSDATCLSLSLFMCFGE